MRLRVFSAITFALLATFQAVSNPSSPIAITHITLIDVRDGSAKPDTTVLISGERIVRVGGPGETLHFWKEARVIDGRGKFLIPGLWDMHIHMGGDERALRSLLASGITGARDMGGDIKQLAERRRQITAGEITGPRLVFGGPRLVGPEERDDTDALIVRNPEEARQAVDSLVTQGANFIKVHDGLDHDTFVAIAEAAKAKGVPFVGHVPASMTPEEASDLGEKSIEHLEFIPKACMVLFDAEARAAGAAVPAGCDPQSLDQLLHRLARNGTWLDPTIASFRYVAPQQFDAILTEFRIISKQIRESGVPILSGTDISLFLRDKGDSIGGSLHDELAVLVDAGFTPAEALRAATWNPALFLGLRDLLGNIETGKIANLVVLGANPLQDIHNTRRIAAVIIEGRYLNRKKLDDLIADVDMDVPNKPN